MFHDSEHADIVTRGNRSQNILRTAAQNELRMEGQRGQEHIALTTPFGSTQLSQGHIVDEQNKPRGSGFELRTDEYGVIRVAKGLFITADGQQKGAAHGHRAERNLKRLGGLGVVDVKSKTMKNRILDFSSLSAIDLDKTSQFVGNQWM